MDIDCFTAADDVRISVAIRKMSVAENFIVVAYLGSHGAFGTLFIPMERLRSWMLLLIFLVFTVTNGGFIDSHH